MATGRATRPLLWILTIASALPVFATRWLPFADLPEHVAAIASLHRIVTSGTTHAEPYQLDFVHSQYLLFHAVGAIVMTVTRDAVLATQVLLAAIAFAWTFAFRSLLRALGRDERLALFAPMVFWNRALVMGFAPFIASIPLAMYALSLLVRRRRVPLGFVSIALFYTHVSTWIVFMIVAGAWTLFHAIRRGRRSLLDAVPLAPSAVAAVVWARAGSLTGSAVPTDASLGHMNLVRSIHALPIWTFDIWRGHLDEAFAAVFWLAVTLAIVLRRHGRRTPILLFLPVACAALVYFLTPFRVGMASMLNVRLAPLVTLFALLPLELPRAARARLPIALVALATLGNAAFTAHEMRATSQEMVGDFDALLAQMRPGSRVAMMAFHRSTPRMHFWPYVFAGAYHRARDGGVAGWSFTELPHWPLHYVVSEAPPAHPPFSVFQPCLYRYRDDGAYFDYALVEGDVDPFPAEHPGYVPIARSGEFILFENHSEKEADPVAGPCDDPVVAASLER